MGQSHITPASCEGPAGSGAGPLYSPDRPPPPVCAVQLSKAESATDTTDKR